MNVKISVFDIYVEAIIYLLLYNLHDCTFKTQKHSVNTSFYCFWNFMNILIDNLLMQFFHVFLLILCWGFFYATCDSFSCENILYVITNH